MSARDASSSQMADDVDAGESQPLVRPLKQGSVWTLCSVTLLVVLALAWCILDSWNHTLIGQLFGLGEMKKLQVNPKTGVVTPEYERFEFPLTLAFVQFAFMGLVFSALWRVCSRDPVTDLHGLKDNIVDKKWLGLTATHMFGTFWLQSMIMPQQMMSIGMFAASRAVDVPTAAVMRSQALGLPLGRTRMACAGMMFLAAWIIFYSYTEIAECLCIWSGHGVELTGISLYVVYLLVLILPAANAVFQESIMVQFQTDPFLTLAVQNVMACIFLAPILIWAQFSGWENVGRAFLMMSNSSEIIMLLLWLCVQTTVISGIGINLISMVDSFWAVSFRSMRVIYWWLCQLFLFYFLSDVSLSVARPNASVWSFAMLCGLLLAATSFFIDMHSEDGRSQKSMGSTGNSNWQVGKAV